MSHHYQEEDKEKADLEVQVGPVEQDQHDEVLKRQLRARHASMLAIGGAIGTGLIIGSGQGLARSGPVGLLLAFIYVGSLCFSMMVVGPQLWIVAELMYSVSARWRLSCLTSGAFRATPRALSVQLSAARSASPTI